MAQANVTFAYLISFDTLRHYGSNKRTCRKSCGAGLRRHCVLFSVGGFILYSDLQRKYQQQKLDRQTADLLTEICLNIQKQMTINKTLRQILGNKLKTV